MRQAIAVALAVVALSGCVLLRSVGIGDGELGGLVVAEPVTVGPGGEVFVTLAHKSGDFRVELIVPPTSKHYRAARILSVLDTLPGGLIRDIQTGEAQLSGGARDFLPAVP